MGKTPFALLCTVNSLVYYDLKFKHIKKNVADKKEQKEEYDTLNLEFFGPIARELKKSGLCAGIHIMSVHYTRITPKLLVEINQ